MEQATHTMIKSNTTQNNSLEKQSNKVRIVFNDMIISLTL